MKAMASVWSMLALLAALFPRPSQTSRTSVDVSKLGPQMGARVPDFTLKDQNGKAWTLHSVMGPKGALLVFYRSADW